MMEFQSLLLQVEQGLDGADVPALAFLCTDLLQRDVSGISKASDLFSLLQDQDLLSAEKPHLLYELLDICRRRSLIRQLHLPVQSGKTQYVSVYRKMLFDLSENITEDELKNMKFLLQNSIPRFKLDKCHTMLRLLQEMEKEALLSHTNLEILEVAVKNVNPSLGKRIVQYKRACEGSQEMGLNMVSTSEELTSPSQVTLSSVYRYTNPGDAEETEWCLTSRPQRTVNDTNAEPPHPLAQMHPPLRNSDSLDGKLSDASNSLSLLSTGDHPSMANITENSHHVTYTSLPEGKNLSSPTVECRSESPYHQELGVYEMKGEKRGHCLIINNYDFSGSQKKLNNREGTHVDEKNLEAVFTWLGFETRAVQDCSRERILSLLLELSRRDHARMDCLVCCVMSHGLNGGVYGVDGAEVWLNELTAPFSGPKCASLQQKPKLFFVQACQGTQEQEPVFQSDGPEPAITTGNDIDSDANVPRDSFPADADFLLGMATIPYYASFRHKKLGTWYVQSLCQKLLQLVPREVDLLSILTEVNNDVGSKSDHGGSKKQMPQPAYSLRKKVVFPKPKEPAPSLT